MDDIPAKLRKRLLLVEDNRDNLETISILLEERYQIFPFLSAAEAMAQIDIAEPDLLLLDIGMQPVDGLECLRAIRTMPRYRRTPAIALTGYAHPDDRQRFLDGGFQAVAVKPIVDLSRFMGMIADLLLPESRLDFHCAARDPSASLSRSASHSNVKSSRSDEGTRP